jgi:hypothetical protein
MEEQPLESRLPSHIESGLQNPGQIVGNRPSETSHVAAANKWRLGTRAGSREHSPIALASLPSSESLGRVQPRDTRAEWRRQFWRITVRSASTERCVAGLHDHWQTDDNHIGSPGQQGTTTITITRAAVSLVAWR